MPETTKPPSVQIVLPANRIVDYSEIVPGETMVMLRGIPFWVIEVEGTDFRIGSVFYPHRSPFRCWFTRDYTGVEYFFAANQVTITVT